MHEYLKFVFRYSTFSKCTFHHWVLLTLTKIQLKQQITKQLEYRTLLSNAVVSKRRRSNPLFVIMLQSILVFSRVSWASVSYLLILVGCDCGELSFWEGEAVHSFSRQRLDLWQVHPRVVPDDVHPWLVFMHRLKNYLGGEKKDILNFTSWTSIISLSFRWTAEIKLQVKFNVIIN